MHPPRACVRMLTPAAPRLNPAAGRRRGRMAARTPSRSAASEAAAPATEQRRSIGEDHGVPACGQRHRAEEDVGPSRDAGSPIDLHGPTPRPRLDQDQQPGRRELRVHHHPIGSARPHPRLTGSLPGRPGLHAPGDDGLPRGSKEVAANTSKLRGSCATWTPSTTYAVGSGSGTRNERIGSRNTEGKEASGGKSKTSGSEPHHLADIAHAEQPEPQGRGLVLEEDRTHGVEVGIREAGEVTVVAAADAVESGAWRTQAVEVAARPGDPGISSPTLLRELLAGASRWDSRSLNDARGVAGRRESLTARGAGSSRSSEPPGG